MKLNLGVLGAVLTGISCMAGVVSAVDQIKNADKRAYITGDAAGRAAVDEMEKRHSKRSLFGTNDE